MTLLCLLLAASSLTSSVGEIAPKAATRKPDQTQRENFPLESAHYTIDPHVDIVTGDYSEEDCDFVCAGCEPLSVRRFYNHFGAMEPRYGLWRYNPEYNLVANLELSTQPKFASIGFTDGSVTRLESFGNGSCTFTQKGYCQYEPSGQTHPLNVKLSYKKVADPKKKGRFQWEGEVTDGSGAKRTFRSPMHVWHDEITDRARSTYTEIEWGVAPGVWTPYHLPVYTEKKPNGNILEYFYERWKEDKNYPKPYLLSAIIAYNSTKTKILGKLAFTYRRIHDVDIGAIDIEGSDGRRAHVQHEGKDPITLSWVYRPDQPKVGYGYFKGRSLNCVAHPDGRRLDTEFDEKTGKVKAQYAPVGPDGKNCPIARYSYQDGYTDMWNAENHKTRYRYDTDKRITAIECYKGEALYSVQRFTWDSKTGNLSAKQTEDHLGRIFQKTDYTYDKNHNPIVETLGDGKQSYRITRTFSDDGFNLKLTEQDDFGKDVRYEYVPGTNLVAAEKIYAAGVLCKQTSYSYDDCATVVKIVTEDFPRTTCKVVTIQPKQSLPCYGLPEVVEEKDGLGKLLKKTIYSYMASGKVKDEEIYDQNGLLCMTFHHAYDEKERLKKKTNGCGHVTSYTYDDNNNVLTQSGPHPKFYCIYNYDQANRPIALLKNGLVTSYFYDKLGNVIAKRDECGFDTHYEYDVQGRLVCTRYSDKTEERKEYDILGNVTAEIDAKGYRTEKTYNFRGQVLSVLYPDGSSEIFTYFPNGNVESQKDRHGTTTTYTYDVFNRPLKTRSVTPEGLVKDSSATYSPFALLTMTDPEGITTFYTYDTIGRKTSEERAGKKTFFFYDAQSRPYKTQTEDICSITLYDNLHREIEKRTETPSGAILTQESYEYDEAGNKKVTRSSKGAYETAFDANNLPILKKNPLGEITTISYSYVPPFTITTTNPKGVRTKQIYNMHRKLAETVIENAKGETIFHTKNHYDVCGNLDEETLLVFSKTQPLKTIVNTRLYGPANRIEMLLEANQKKTIYLYDNSGRLKTKVKPDGTKLHSEYDGYGRLKHFYGPDFDYVYDYDLNDQLLSVTHDGTTTTRRYNALGNIIEEKLGTGHLLKSTYDSLGRRKSLTLPDNSTVTYTYQNHFLSTVTRNNFTHTYTHDLDGNISEMTLPSNLGTVTFERDKLSRLKSTHSPFYTSLLTYDTNGNLTHLDTNDAIGSYSSDFTYDDLDQLLSENAHTYSYDSICNRLSKNGYAYTVNDLSQITSDNTLSYTYDANGNLTQSGTTTFTYDSLDRLTSVTQNNQTTTFSYDPFHRRLSKKSRYTTTYIWDGSNEIGAMQYNYITELRILGEGLGAELGAAVLLELNDTPYIPLHDHRGCLITLLTPSGQATALRYTAFGEALTPTPSPWTFSSKRYDSETTFFYFGRRYYSAPLGRWISPDPEGFHDGPNLYAYVHNRALTLVDLHGLYTFPLFFGRMPQSYPAFEKQARVKSHCYDLQRPELPRGGIFYINGMDTTFNEAREFATLASDMAGKCNIRGIYNSTQGKVSDFFECILNTFGIATPPVLEAKKSIIDFCEQNPSKVPFMIINNSQGALIAREALKRVPKPMRDRAMLTCIAPGGYISPYLCRDVKHYTSKSDFVPLFDWKGRKACKHTIIELNPHPDAKSFDHSCKSKTYRSVLKEQIDIYLDIVRNCAE